VHVDLFFEFCSEVKSRVSINHSSDVCLNCCLKFPFFFLRHFLLQNVGRDWLKERPFFSFCIICRPIDMMTVNNHVRIDVYE
jgi:hypothetical protein